MTGEVQLEPSGERNPSDSDPLLENQANSLTGSSNEIKDEEIEAASAACCRICLEYDGEPDEDLISPCMCKGTQQFVHRSCLDHWRSVKEGFAFSHCTTCKAQFHLRVELLEDNSWRKVKFRIFVARDVLLVFLVVQTVIAAMGGFAYLMDKNGNFRNSFSDGWDRYCQSIQYPFTIALVYWPSLCYWGFLVSYYIAPPSTIMTHAWLAAGIVVMDGASWTASRPLWKHALRWLSFLSSSLAILGIAYGFLAATMAIQRIWQRHYHILTKRELTKEYVVEDLHGNYTPPKLDPEHEERLKSLKLM